MKYYIPEGLTSVPDSIVKNRRTVEIDFSPSRTIIGHFGDADAASKNNLKQLPVELCKLKNLRKINLSYNDIRQLPSCFCKLKRLQYVDLSYNVDLDIVQVVNELKQLKNLRTVNLFGIEKAVLDSANIKSRFKNSVQVIITNYDFDKLIKDLERK